MAVVVVGVEVVSIRALYFALKINVILKKPHKCFAWGYRLIKNEVGGQKADWDNFLFSDERTLWFILPVLLTKSTKSWWKETKSSILEPSLQGLISITYLINACKVKSFRKDETQTSWTQVEHFFNIFIIKIRFSLSNVLIRGESNFDDK